jgi:hypothetical protein
VTAPPLLIALSLHVEQTFHATPAHIEHVGVDLRRLDARVPEQFLHRADVVT